MTTTALSKNNGAIASQMTILGDSTELIITTVDCTPGPDDAYLLTVPLDVPIVDGHFTIPNDGRKWWMVPFNDAETPEPIYNGGDATFVCSCGGQGSGGCTIVHSTQGGKNYSWCNEDGCMVCCTSALIGVVNLFGSYQLVDGAKLNYNGVLYTW